MTTKVKVSFVLVSILLTWFVTAILSPLPVDHHERCMIQGKTLYMSIFEASSAPFRDSFCPSILMRSCSQKCLLFATQQTCQNSSTWKVSWIGKNLRSWTWLHPKMKRLLSSWQWYLGIQIASSFVLDMDVIAYFRGWDLETPYCPSCPLGATKCQFQCHMVGTQKKFRYASPKKTIHSTFAVIL